MAQLQITAVEGKNLMQKDRFSKTDTFLQIYLDDISQKQKSSTRKNSNNPKWNQTFFLYDYFTSLHCFTRFILIVVL